MDKEIYKYLKDEDVIGLLANDIIEAFKTKMNKDTIDYSFDIAKGTGKIKIVKLDQPKIIVLKLGRTYKECNIVVISSSI